MVILLLSVVSLVVLLYALLWIPAVQQKVKDVALAQVMKITGNQLSIGSLQLRPFNSIRLTQVYVADLQGDTLLYADQLMADFSIRQLLSKRISITAIELNDFNIHLKRDSANTDFNFQFLITAFASQDTVSVPSDNPFAVELGDIQLHNGQLSYDITSAPPLVGGFDANHIDVRKLNTELVVHSFDPERLNVELKTLSLHEQGGFELVSLSAQLSSEKDKYRLDDLKVQLPNSQINLTEAWIDFTEDGLITKAAYSLSLESTSLQATDLQAFHAPLKDLTERTSFKIKAAGKLPILNIDTFNVSYGQHFTVSAQGKLNDYLAWDQCPLQVSITNLSTDAQGLEQLSVLWSEEKQAINQLTKADKLRLTADISGSIPNLNLRVAVSNPAWQTRQLDENSRATNGRLQNVGAPQLTFQGKAGYIYATGNSHFDVRMMANNFNLRSLVNNPDVGLLNMNLQAKGELVNNKLNADLSCFINDLVYQNYHYHAIELNGKYRKDSIMLNMACKDTNIPLEMQLKVDLRNPKQLIADLQIQAEHILLSKIGMLPKHLEADLRMQLKARVEGTEIDHMKAFLQFDDLRISTSKGRFHENLLRIDFLAQPPGTKQISLHSGILDAELQGEFSFGTLATSMQNTLADYFPQFIQAVKVKKKSSDQFELVLAVNNTEQLASSIGLPVSLVLPAKLTIRYGFPEQDIQLMADLPKLKINEMVLLNTTLDLTSDTLHNSVLMNAYSSRMNTEGNDTLEVRFTAKSLIDSIQLALNLNSRSSATNLKGDLKGDVHFTRIEGQALPAILVNILPTSLHFNQQVFEIKASSLEIRDNYYRIDNFELSYSDMEHLKVNGVISLREEDSLTIQLGKIRLETVMTALQNTTPLKGTVDGKIIVYELLSAPHFTTEGFSIEDIRIAEKPIGTLRLKSTWDEQLKGLLVDARLQKTSDERSTLSGIFFPTKDSLDLKMDMRGIELDLLSSFTQSSLFGLAGQMLLQANVKGKLSKPLVEGILFFDKANIGLRATNTQYHFTDTVYLHSDKVVFNDFRILDQKNQAATIKGDVTLNKLGSFITDVTIRMEDFMVLNNAHQTDSLYYGTLAIKGNIAITGTEKELIVKAGLANQPNGRIFFMLPESVNEAQRYNSITYINTGVDSTIITLDTELKKIDFPLKLQLTFNVTPDLTLGTVINPSSKDEATINGSGTIDLGYDMRTAQMNITGVYTVREGRANISLMNITRRTFIVRPGSTISFKGDPMATAFDITVEYSLRANLSNLDPNFETFLPATRTRVNCLLNVAGTAKKITIGYDLEFPDLDENMKRKTASLLNTEEIKIREIAYLMALGTFSGTNNNANHLWTSLASASLTTQLNNLLSGVLNENWTIGTELHSDNNNTSGVEMDVNISTQLFNQRLTVSSNIGYKNTLNANNNNLTGDFDARYKLTKTGDIILRMYQVANQHYFDQALTTQGVGLIYKKQEKKFWNLFRRRKKQ